MQRSVRVVLAMIALAGSLLPGAAAAQSREGPALVIGAPTFIGVLIPLSARLSLRPDITYTLQVFSFAGSTSLSTVGLGISTLHYLGDTAGVRPYVTPRFGYAFTRFSEPGAPRASVYQLSAAFGAQAKVTGRLGVFAEGGLELTYNESDNGGVVVVNRRWSTATRVGATIGF